MRDMYRKLPMLGGEPRVVAEVVNNLIEGKSNNTGEVTLDTGWATTTTIYNERIGYNSIILLTPFSANAGADKLPYGSISSTETQYATTASAVTFNTEDYNSGVYLSSNKMYFRNAGDYNLQFSVQMVSTDTQDNNAYIWLRKNGTNVAGTGSKYDVPSKHGSSEGYLIAVANFFVTVAAGDYIELMWSAANYANASGTTLGVFLEAYTAAGSLPAIPSAVLTAQFNQASASTNVYVSSRSQGSATLTHFANNTADKTYGYVVIA